MENKINLNVNEVEGYFDFLCLKVCNVHELIINADNIDNVRFEYLALPFSDDRLKLLLDDLGAEDLSDLGILEAETELHIDIDGDEDIMQLNTMAKYLDENLFEFWDDIDSINDLIDADVISKYDLLECNISAYTDAPFPVFVEPDLKSLGIDFAKAIGLYDKLVEANTVEAFDFKKYAESLLDEGKLIKGRTNECYNGIKTRILTQYYAV